MKTYTHVARSPQASGACQCSKCGSGCTCATCTCVDCECQTCSHEAAL